MPAARVVIALKLSALVALVTAAVLWPAPAGGPGGGVAHAQWHTLARTFLNPTPAADDNFGRSVAALGGNVLVGAPNDDTGASSAGAAYLFDGASGAFLRTFLNPTPAVEDYFGASVAAVGDNVLVGAHLDDTGATNAGAAYLFDATTGVLLQTFLNPMPATSDAFGSSVAAVGGNVLVGAPFDHTGALRAGAAYLFDATSGVLLQTFLNPTPAVSDLFGVSVAPLGGNVLVGAHNDNTGATNAGAAYLFDASTSALLRTFLNPNPADDDDFGVSVAGLGGNVLVGAYLDDAGATDAGAAYLFDAASGGLLDTFLNPTPATGDWFGISVAALGSNVLVGAPGNLASGEAGTAYLFDAANAALLETFLNPTAAAGDQFGWSVAAVGGNVLVGAYLDDAGATDAGAAYLFEAPAVGGVAELPAAAQTPRLDGGSGSSGPGAGVLAGLAAAGAAAIVLGGAAWWTRRRDRES